ncbi:hypothetical protein NN561_007451 [Cricetulus griseus]
MRASPELREATIAVPVSKKRPPASCRSPEPSTHSHNFPSPGHLQSHLRTELGELLTANLSSLGPRALPSPLPSSGSGWSWLASGTLGARGLAYLAWCGRCPAPRSHEAPSPNPREPKNPAQHEGRRRSEKSCSAERSIPSGRRRGHSVTVAAAAKLTVLMTVVADDCF